VRLIFWGVAVLLGLIAVFFAKLCNWGNSVFFSIYEKSPYLPFLVCPFGLVTVVYLQRKFFEGSEGSGIPQVLAAAEAKSWRLQNKLLSLRVVVGKVLGALGALLCGASIGREGPSVHIGAALFNFTGHFARFSRFERRQGLILAGGAAGISAAFTAPLAGIVFAIEELHGSFGERQSNLLLSAVVLAGLTSVGLLGYYTHFGVSSTYLTELSHGVAVIVIAVSGGLLGGLFSRGILSLNHYRHFIFKGNPYRLAALCGFFIASVGYFSEGRTFGMGYEQAETIMLGGIEGMDLILFPLEKMFATFVSYLSGVPGGVFAPSLSAGAGLGGAFSLLFSDIPFQPLVIIGMVSYLSGVIRAPVTSFMIVYEMINNHYMIFPIIAAAFIAAGASKLVCQKPLYRGLMESYLRDD